jgi:predicted  nucleic acid-binding Zn-ribbon protein
LSATRKELRSGVAEETLTHYDRVLKLRGSVVAPVYEDESCSACRVRLRPQVFQEVTSNEQIVTCFYCNRILYYVPPPPPEPEEAAAKSAKVKPANQESVEADEAAAQ